MSVSRRWRLSQGRGNSHLRWLNSSSSYMYSKLDISAPRLFAPSNPSDVRPRETKQRCISSVVRGGEQWHLECESSRGHVPIASWTTEFRFDSPLHPHGPENCHDAIAVGAPYCLTFVSQGESRPGVVQLLGRRGGGESQTRSNTFGGVPVSGNAKPGEEREEGEDGATVVHLLDISKSLPSLQTYNIK